MSRRRGKDSIQQSRVRLYEDTIVTKKAGKLSSKEELTITTARIATAASSGEESVFVELTAWRKKTSSRGFPVPKFQVNVSCSGCSYQINESKLKITISHFDEARRLKEQYLLRMNSMQQLRAWTAELIQASTFEPENTLQRCFHVVVPEMSSRQTASNFEHFVLQGRHPHDGQLVIRHPLRLTDVKCWDLSKLKAFSFVFFPRPLLCVQPTDELLFLDLSSSPEETIHFLSAEVARQALNFVELLLETRMPKLYLKANKQVYSRQTSNGDVTRAVTFDFLKYRARASSVQRVLSFSPVNSKIKVPTVPLSSFYGIDTEPYSVVDVVANAATPLPPTNLIRPGLAPSRVLDGYNYVKLSKVETSDSTMGKNAPIEINFDSQPNDNYDDVTADVPDDAYEDVAADSSDDAYEDVAAD